MTLMDPGNLTSPLYLGITHRHIALEPISMPYLTKLTIVKVTKFLPALKFCASISSNTLRLLTDCHILLSSVINISNTSYHIYKEMWNIVSLFSDLKLH